ncbi:unnamed protein product [Candidula unifasciata]|uniref:Secreted protein n=1 Tax=Candidula unifasciata TaxID=100452 RepID=A0A8S3Z1U3_9EUPU|nr:unnamed protein product [Candidula unifasciata]
MLESGSMAALAVVCSWLLVYGAAEGVGGKQFSRTGYPQVPWLRGGFPASRGDEFKQNKATSNVWWPLPGGNRNPSARAQDRTGDERGESGPTAGVPSSRGAGFGQANRRYRRDYGGLDNQGFYPGAPLWGSGLGYGRPGGDYGRDFGYQSDGWRSK